MIVTSQFNQLPAGRRVFALGNFDGVHIGHQALFRQAVKLAQEQPGEAIAFAFHPHPLQVLGFQLESITTDQEKIRLIARQGLSAYLAMPFDRELANMPPGRFVDEILLGQALADAVVVGYNFSFGKGGAGTPEFLQRTLAARGVPVMIVPPVLAAGEAVSSTRIRQYIRQGDLDSAAVLLGRPYCLAGTVEQGDQRGRTLGYPTANLYGLQGLTLPPFGVYAATVPGIGSGMANLGLRPSFPQSGPSLEVHIFDWQGDLYGQRIEVRLLKFIRGELLFHSLSELKQQLLRDQAAIRQALSSESAN